MDLLLLAIQTGFAYGLAGLAVRVALTVFGGFDLFVAIAALFSAELVVAAGNAVTVETIAGTFVAASTGVLAAGAAGYLWGLGGSLFRTKEASNLAIFVGSLGALMVAVGLTGVTRGPGLRAMEGIAGQAVEFLGTYVGVGVIAGPAITGVVTLASLVWLRQRAGYALRLYAMDPLLAEEIGIDENRLRRQGTVYAGLCAGAAGCSLALTGGSTPELGMKAFLYGAGAALLFESRELLAPLVAGLILGMMQVGLQLILAPAWTESVMFALIVAVLLWRGTSREVGGVR